MLRWYIAGCIESLLAADTSTTTHPEYDTPPLMQLYCPQMRVDYNKLVRDRIPEIIGCRGDRAVTRVLDAAGYRDALLAKLVEEAREATGPPGGGT
jgi:hypothetical protein